MLRRLVTVAEFEGGGERDVSRYAALDTNVRA
jgi:hypothetical protein